MPFGSNVFCLRHPERHGVARCMACNVAVCQECATRFDGINYCVTCLAKTRSVQKSKNDWQVRAGLALALGITIPATIVVLGYTVSLWTRIMH